MEYIDVLIPTRNRMKKLLAAVESIDQEDWVRVVIVFDGDMPEDYRALKKAHPNLVLYCTGRHVGSVHARNLFAHATPDGLLNATDDAIFRTGSLKRLRDQFNRDFEDEDGVIGVRQEDAHHPTGICLMGRKFLDRFPGRQPYCPEYWHFAAQEIHWLSAKLDKYKTSDAVLVKHFAPYNGGGSDQTHREAREHDVRDHDLARRRRAEKLIWGEK